MLASKSLSLDISTLYLAAAMASALLGAMLLFFWRKENIAALGWWGAAYLLGAASIALWTIGGPNLGDGLALAINAVGFIACGLMWDAARVFHGRKPTVIGILAGSAVWVAANLLFDLAPEPLAMLGAGIVAAYTTLTATELLMERRKAMRSRWPTIIVPLLHGGVLMLPILLGDLLQTRAGAGGLDGIWIAAFAAELVLYAVGTVFITFMLVSERTVSVHKVAAAVDPLTGLFNRRGFGEATSRIMERESQAERPVSVMILDIDHFKSVNDRFGHAAGDELLKVFANVLTNTLRITDLVGRIGGEEFAALLPCSTQEAAQAAERVRQAFQDSGVAVDGDLLETTVSIGIAGGPAHTELELLLAAADVALYQAKRTGRNRIETALEEPLSLDQTRLTLATKAALPRPHHAEPDVVLANLAA